MNKIIPDVKVLEAGELNTTSIVERSRGLTLHKQVLCPLQFTSSTIFWVPFLFDIPSGSVIQPYSAESLTTQALSLCPLPAACFSSNRPKYDLNPP